MSGGFFRGTSADQDTRFSNKQAKLMKSQKFPPELENLVDITKVKMDVMRPWIANRVTELLGFEDEVLINFIYGLLDGKVVNGKEIQISITGFMEKNTAKFMKELWTLLLSAEKNASGVPQQFLDAKEEETRKKKVETDRITHEIQKRKEKEVRELEQEKEDKMAGKVGNSTRADYDAFGTTSRQRKPRDSSIRSSEDEKEANGRDRSRERIRETPSRSNSRSFSNSRSRSEHRSRSLSVSPRKRRSDSVERVHRSPPRRSPTPHRRDSPQRSFSPTVRQTSHYRQRSISPPHRRSPSPVARRVRRSRSPIRRRSRSPIRRRSRSPLRRRSRSPVRRRSRTPLRRRSRTPLRRRSRTPLKRRSRTPLRRRSRTPLRRRSRTPLRRRRSPLRHRSRSPIRRRSGSPIRRRSRSPIRRRSPVHHESSSPVRGRSPSPVRRLSPAPVRHESSSPVRGRSPSPVRRRSPAPVRRRFPSLVQGRSPSPVRQLSPSPVRQLSPSPVRHQSPSPVGRRSSPSRRWYRRSSSSPRQRRSTPKSHSSPREMSPHSPIHLPDSEVKISLKHQSPPVETPRNRIRTQEQYSPARQTTRREVIKHSSEIRKGSTLERQIHKSSQRSPQRDRSGRNSLHGGVPSLSPSPYSSPDGSDSPPTSRPKGLGRDSRTSSRHESPQRAPVVDNIRASPRQKSKGNMAIPVGQPMGKALGSSEAEDPKGKSSREKMMHSPAPEEFKVLVQKDNHDVKGGGRNESGTVDRKSIIAKERNNRGSDDSDYDASGKHRSEAREKRKHKRSKRRESGDDDDDDHSSDSQLEGRKAAKRRRKEEKKLRKEERRRRREERRRRRDERRAKKIELKTVGVSPQSDLAENHQDYISDGARAARRDSHSSDSEVSEQKKLEIALREKALETLRAKKSAGH